jgi:hypothetical protein
MSGSQAFEIRTTEPAVGEIEIDLLALTPLCSDGEPLTDQRYPVHRRWIDRTTPIDE